MFTSKQRPMPMAQFPSGMRLVADRYKMTLDIDHTLMSLKLADVLSFPKEYSARDVADRMPICIYDEEFLRPAYLDTLFSMPNLFPIIDAEHETYRQGKSAAYQMIVRENMFNHFKRGGFHG
jgi:hypothetical protein